MSAEPWREPWLRALLRCPVDRAELLDATGPDTADGTAGEPVLRCSDPGHRVAFPISGGVPVLIADDAQPLPEGA